MRDRDIRSEREWQQGLDYMKRSVQDRLQYERQNVLDTMGSQSWVPWRGLTPKQKINTAVLDEIKKIAHSRGGRNVILYNLVNTNTNKLSKFVRLI